jgi:hypothetical protein
VLFVVKVTLIGESLNSFVMHLVSLPIYVNLAHFWLSSDCFSFLLVFVNLSISEVSNLFLLIMCLMVFLSLSLFSLFSLCVFILLIICRIAAFMFLRMA